MARCFHPVTQKKSVAQQELSDFVLRRRHVVDMITMEKNHLEKNASCVTKTRIEKHSRVLEKYLEQVESYLKATLAKEALKEAVAVL